MFVRLGRGRGRRGTGRKGERMKLHANWGEINHVMGCHEMPRDAIR